MKTSIRATIKRLIPQSVIRRQLRRGGDNCLALTFDDGPHPDLTPKVLDLLDRFRVRACFFVIGKLAEKHPGVVQDIRRRGHVLGNHSYEHPPGDYDSRRECRLDIERCQRLIRELIGEEADYFRPPRGRITLTGLMVARRLGLKTILWARPREARQWGVDRADDAPSIAHSLLSSARERDIVILHDNDAKIIDILRIVLPSLKQRNFDLHDAITWL